MKVAGITAVIQHSPKRKLDSVRKQPSMFEGLCYAMIDPNAKRGNDWDKTTLYQSSLAFHTRMSPSFKDS